MGVIFDEPKYPVLDKAPGFWKTVSNFSLTDWATVGVSTGGFLPIGYITGSSSGLPKQSMYVAGLIGLTGGFFYAYQSSAGRLMGFFPNDKEVNNALQTKG